MAEVMRTGMPLFLVLWQKRCAPECPFLTSLDIEWLRQKQGLEEVLPMLQMGKAAKWLQQVNMYKGISRNKWGQLSAYINLVLLML